MVMGNRSFAWIGCDTGELVLLDCPADLGLGEGTVLMKTVLMVVW